MIHTSCRSESSNISLVVLDKLSLCPNAPQARQQSLMHFSRKHSELVKLFRLSLGFTPSDRSPTCLSPQTWWGCVLDSWTVKNTETTSCSDPTTAGHLSGEIGTNSPLTPFLSSSLKTKSRVKSGNLKYLPQSEVNKKSVYSTMYSQAVTHPSTNMAQCCLTSVIRRELVFST